MANLVRMDPAREMMSLREAMDRLFEESFLRPGLLGNGESAAGMLPIDVYETENAVFVKAAVPGIKPEDIDVTLTGDLLTIEASSRPSSGKKSATTCARAALRRLLPPVDPAGRRQCRELQGVIRERPADPGTAEGGTGEGQEHQVVAK